MSGFLSEAEQALGNSSGNDQQSSGNDQQSTGSSDQSSSGGLMGKVEGAGEDAMIDQSTYNPRRHPRTFYADGHPVEVNDFATKEGIPSGADGFIDKEVNAEVGKF